MNMTRRNKGVVLGYALLGGIYTCLMDFDHVPLWIFGIVINWTIPNLFWEIQSAGRLLHSLLFWIPVNIILAGGLTSFLVRFLQSKTLSLKEKDY